MVWYGSVRYVEGFRCKKRPKTVLTIRSNVASSYCLTPGSTALLVWASPHPELLYSVGSHPTGLFHCRPGACFSHYTSPGPGAGFSRHSPSGPGTGFSWHTPSRPVTGFSRHAPLEPNTSFPNQSLMLPFLAMLHLDPALASPTTLLQGPVLASLAMQLQGPTQASPAVFLQGPALASLTYAPPGPPTSLPFPHLFIYSSVPYKVSHWARPHTADLSPIRQQ